MNICIPVNEDLGLQSPVCAHFGSAPLFLIVDTDTDACRAVVNQHAVHAHGMCQPLAALSKEQLDGIVVGGIGMGALMKLKASNIEVFLSKYSTVDETIAAYKTGSLQPMTPQNTCAGHGHGPQGRARHGCGHHS